MLKAAQKTTVSRDRKMHSDILYFRWAKWIVRRETCAVWFTVNRVTSDKKEQQETNNKNSYEDFVDRRNVNRVLGGHICSKSRAGALSIYGIAQVHAFLALRVPEKMGCNFAELQPYSCSRQ